MYLSNLLIDVGDNPDRPRPGRLWLRNLYHVHQRLCMAFPYASRKANDAEFLKPFHPEDFGSGQVHVTRAENSGFLFRIDSQSGGRAVILVQSAVKPDWDYAFHNAGYLLAAPPQIRPFDPCFSEGQQLRFRIRANLSKKIKRSTGGVDLTKAREGRDRMGRMKAQSKRVALTWDKGRNPQDAIREWFAAKGSQGGFRLEAFRALQIGWVAGNRPSSGAPGLGCDSPGHHMKFRCALLEGTLTVTNEAKFRETILRGIGHGKAFGLGLLSVSPARGDV
jgi:CRISPR system Cascade subunit CasE